MGNGEAAAQSPGAEGEVDRRTLHKAIGGSAVGNAIEWYDYGLYGFLTAAIAHNFLPGEIADTAVGTMVTFIIFAVPFVVRPFGAAVFGAIGDRIGRQKILALTVILISGGTFLIGCIPNFATISYAAPILLVLFRVVQGLAAGGEYGGAATFMAEYSPDKQRGFYGSFLEVGTLIGFLIGTLVSAALQSVMAEDVFLDWGWRIPFLLAGPIGLFGLYMRSKLEDTPVFKELQEQGSNEQSTKALFADMARNWKPVLICLGMVFMLNIVNYTLFTYIVEFLTDEQKGGMSASDALWITSVMFALTALLLPFFGAASDRLGRRTSWFFSSATLFVCVLPAFWVLLNGPIALKMVALVVLGLLYAPQLGTISATFPALFPTHIRYAAFAISYNVATAIAGGPTPAINTALADAWTPYFPALFMMVGCVIGAIATYFAPESAGASLRGTEIPDAHKQAVVGRSAVVTD